MKKDVFANIESSMVMRSLKKNTVLRFPKLTDKFVFYLKEGLLKIAAMNDEGKEVIKCLIRSGTVFGEMSLLNEQECKEDYAVALEDCTIGLIDTTKMKQLMEADEELRATIFQHIAKRICRIENRLLAISFKGAYARVCDFMIEFAKEFGQTTTYGYEAKNLLTHDDIAKLTTTSRQTVSSILNELREQKLIEYNNELVKIPYSSNLFRDR